MSVTKIADLTPHSMDALLSSGIDAAQMFHAFLRAKPADERTSGVHASEICTCKRQTAYTLLGTERRTSADDEMQKRFLVGTAVHNALQGTLHLMAGQPGSTFDFVDEVRTEGVPLAERLMITSSCDGIFTFHADARKNAPLFRVGLEIKTEAPDSFAKLSAPRPKHVEQAHVYMKVFDLPFMWFLYFNKGNQNITPMVSPWVLPFNPDIWNRIEGRIHEVVQSLEQNQLPDREEGYHCSWCPFVHLCEPPSRAKYQPKPSVPNRSFAAHGHQPNRK